MSTHAEFDCYYEDGTTLYNQVECPLMISSGAQLVNSEYRIVEDVSAASPAWWIFLVIALILGTRQR